MKIEEQIKNLLKKHPVLLFMKGSPEAPQCGFSARVVQILNFLNIKFHYFDILTDESIRSGIKAYAKWPTIPQLYINQVFIGGCDIVQEQFENGELQKKLTNLASE